MTLLDMHRSQLQRERDAAAKDRRAIADASAKAVGKEREVSRNPSASRQRSLLSDLQRLGTTRAAAEKSLASHEKKIADLSRKIATEEAAVQKEGRGRPVEPAERDRETRQKCHHRGPQAGGAYERHRERFPGPSSGGCAEGSGGP